MQLDALEHSAILLPHFDFSQSPSSSHDEPVSTAAGVERLCINQVAEVIISSEVLTLPSTLCRRLDQRKLDHTRSARRAGPRR
jgi:hypothetical protein